MLITVDIWKFAKERTYSWRTQTSKTIHYIRVWRVISILGIPVFAWVVNEHIL